MTAAQTGALNGHHGYRVLVIVGTDHHPFNRLITWVNDWLGQHPEQVSDFFVQWGSAAVRPVCAGAQILTTEQLSALLDEVSAVICHGGGGSISDAWGRGQAPIVVPRLPQLGEHVDDHQVHFGAKLAELGLIRLAPTQAAFFGFLDEATGDPRGDSPIRGRIGSLEAEVNATVARFAALVDELASRPRRRLLGGFRPMRRVPRPEIGPAPQPLSLSQTPVSGGGHELRRGLSLARKR